MGGNELVAGVFAAEGMEEECHTKADIDARSVELEHGLDWAGAKQAAIISSS